VAIIKPKYSVCITTYNKGERVRTSLESLLTQIDDRFEIVVTDNLSNDGSEEILREYARNKKIRLFQTKCSRGLGREIAFENARGEYIVSGIDTDDVLIPDRLSLLLDFYHNTCDGNLLRVQWSGISVAPADLVRRVGGWRDLQWSDNWDLFERASRIGKYVWTIFRVKDVIRLERPGRIRGVHPSLEETTSIIKKNKMRYMKYVDELRLRKRDRPFSEGESFGVGKGIDYVLALISLPHFGHLNSARPSFSDHSPRYFVDSSKWWHRVGQDEKQEVMMYSRLLKQTPYWVSQNVV
jgi:glycosyltransferase involved in cell wall biosynthesis